MKIFVCVKHVPDSAINIAVKDNCSIDENIGFILNPYDENAVTEAVRLRDNHPGSEVVAVCLGKESAMEAVRSALAMGADRGILIVSDKINDCMTTANALSAAIEQDAAPDIILLGKESIDAVGMQTMYRIAACMDLPVVNNITRIEVAAGKAVVDTMSPDGGTDTYEMALPCVVGAGKNLNDPEYPTFRQVMTSKKKPVKTIQLNELNLPLSKAGVEVVALEPFSRERKSEALTGSLDDMAKQIIHILEDEVKVL